jgi:hypothetical protein
MPQKPIAGAFHPHHQAAASPLTKEHASLQGKPGIRPNVYAPGYIQLFPADPGGEVLQHLRIRLVIPEGEGALSLIPHKGTNLTKKLLSP